MTDTKSSWPHVNRVFDKTVRDNQPLTDKQHLRKICGILQLAQRSKNILFLFQTNQTGRVGTLSVNITWKNQDSEIKVKAGAYL